MKTENVATRPGEPAEEVRHWLGEIGSAKKREKNYRKDGEEVIEIYSGKCPDKIPFNILFSNVETLLPALFSQTPRPVVQRRFKDEDPLGKAAAMAAQRMLEFLCDTNVEGYETFDQAMRYATLDGLLPGRGITSIKYDTEIIEPEEGSENPPVMKWEQVCPDSRGWDKVYFGYAKKWSKVPWLAYEEFLDKDECERLFGSDVTAKIVFTKGEDEDDDEKGTGTGGRDDADTQGSRKTALVYQIWDRSGGKRILYISPAYNDGYLKEEDDPLGLTGFFNCPRPLQFIEKSNDLLPVAMYKLYENQAKELNRITTRLSKVVEALKVRGVYDGSLGDQLGTLFEGSDNTLIAAETASSLASEKGLDNAIWFMPIEKLIVVATNLVAAREQCKRVIYEITGVSDIIRGQSVASETLGAQKIKESWGTMRLKRLQKEVQRYSRDVLRIMLEIAATKFSVETWASATGLPFVTSAQKQQAQMIAQMQQQQAMAQQVPGQPPQQPPIDPQIQKALSAPEWEQVLELLKNDMQRSYRIDIETNSTIDVEATEDQQQIGDFMNAMGQLMAGLTPMVETGGMPFEAAQSLLLAVVRRFRFGTEVEDHFKNMKAPEKGNPEADKAKAEMAAEQQKMQVEGQMRQAEMQMEQQQFQAEMQMEAQKSQSEMQMTVMQAKMEAQMTMQLEQAKLQAQAQVDAAKLSSQRSIEQMKANIQKDTQLQMASLQAATQIEIAKINASVQAAQASEAAESEAEGAEMESAKSAQSEAMMAAVLETQAKLLATLAAPKVGTLSNGKTIRIETEKE